MRRLSFFLMFLAGCQTVQQRNFSLAQDRAHKLRPLSSWQSLQCRVDVELTEPARARYREMFPGESIDLPSYVWEARESGCEIVPVMKTPVASAQQAFLLPTLCLLFQTHFVNSPFDELSVLPEDLVDAPGAVQIRTDLANADLGMFLAKDDFHIETRTKSRGVLGAKYESQAGRWLPVQMAQTNGPMTIAVDEVEYADARLRSFWIFVGTTQPLRHSRAVISECK
ncbi:MAG TPA: hypothetical protein PKC28_14630 [Bdellovibrionales bacterium]|nr:hypothetical protein [Bdellovibrionales bacterium]